MNRHCSFIIAPLLLALAGCTLMPNYHQPVAPISTSWPESSGHGQTPTNAAPVPAADIGWREFFRDERLQQLIEVALTNNLDLRMAMCDVEQTQALYRVQRNQLIPTVDVNA